jgi:hypothetical protein
MSDEELSDLAWEIIFDLINLGLISDKVPVEELDLPHKIILKRLKEIHGKN